VPGLRYAAALFTLLALVVLAGGAAAQETSTAAPTTITNTTTATVTYYLYTVPGLGKIKFSTDGVVWVELSPITMTATYAHQRVMVNFVAVPNGTVTVPTTNIFGLNKTLTTNTYAYMLVLVNDCYATPCFNATFIPMDLNGSAYTTVVLDGLANKSATVTLPTDVVRVRYCLGECREVVGYAIRPVPVPALIGAYVALVPLAFFVGLGLRGDLKAAGMGTAAYAFVAPIITTLLGLDLGTSVALTALIFAVALLMLYVASR